jgi:hypothetical protein
MFLNQFESSKAARLNQILHTLAAVHSLELKFDYESPRFKRDLLEVKQNYQTKQNKIVEESGFNSYQTNPEYIKSILILEAVKIILTEISPKRRKRKKIRESQTISETLKHVQNYEKDNKRVEVWQETATGQYKIKMFEKDVHIAKLDAVADSQQEANEVVQDRLSRVVNDNNSGSKGYSSMLSKWENLATKMKDYKSNNTKLQKDFHRVGQELLDKGSPYDLTSNDQHVVKMAMKFLKTDESLDSDVTIMQANNAHHTDKPGMHNVHETSPNTDLTENKGLDMTKQKESILENAMHMQQEYEYQASMARSELYRNTKYAMAMLKQIDPYSEIQPWIAANLTKAANYLDKIFHYLDYYKKFEPEKLPEGMDGDMELGETSGGVARENLMLIMEYSIKLFHIIQPGEKLEGWVAMKLTTASECISSCRHYLEYVQFEHHGLDSHFDEGRRAMKRKMDESKLMEAEAIEDLQKAQTVISANEMADEVQKIAEKAAQLSVEKLMPLVDSMRAQFGTDVANGFNEVVKGALEQLLDTATKSKETMGNAVATVQRGGVPGVGSDIENAGAPGEQPAGASPEVSSSEEPAGAPPSPSEPKEPLGRAKKSVAEARFEFDKKTGGMKLNKEDPDQRHGLYGADGKLIKATNTKDEAENLKNRDPKYKNATIKKIAESKKVNEKWDAKMHTSKKDMGKWDGWTVAKLKSKKAKLMKKEKRTAAEQKTVKQLTFAIRAKQKNKWGKIKESLVAEKAPPGKKAEKWIKSNKARFLDQYGKKKGMNVLYATAWKMFGESNTNYENAKKLVEGKNKMLENLNNQFALHRQHFAAAVAKGKVKDPLTIGYGIEGEALLQKIDNIRKEITEANSVIAHEMKVGITKLLENINAATKAEKLASLKSVSPYGVIYNRNGKLSQKMFESADHRQYWLDFNNDEITDIKLIEPETFDKAIDSTLKGN